GPHLPLDGPFAAGNFFGDACRGGPIQVRGDGAAMRSYLYGADLAIWLWHIALRGQSGRPYNVGSDRVTSIAGLAQTIAAQFSPQRPIEFGAQTDRRATRYVPAINRARTELGLDVRVDLEGAVARTAHWLTDGAN